MEQSNSNMIACIECDLMMRSPAELQVGHDLACPRCHHVLARGYANAAETVLSLSLTALIALLISVSFSFLSFEIGGQSNAVSLLSVAEQLYDADYGILGVIVLTCMVLLPFMYLASLVVLTLQAQMNLRSPSQAALAKMASRVYPWTMVDVFIFGVLVALVKMRDMADVNLGLSFWSYIVFTLLFIRIASIVDTHRLWSWVRQND